MENQNGRNNIRTDGLAKDKAHVSWAETEKQVRDFLVNKLNIHSKWIERAHCTGKWKHNSDKARPVVVRCLRFKDKELVLFKARAMLKNSSIYVNEDFSDLLSRKRAKLILTMKKAREQGNYAIISYDRLVVWPKMPQQRQEPPLQVEVSKVYLILTALNLYPLVCFCFLLIF